MSAPVYLALGDSMSIDLYPVLDLRDRERIPSDATPAAGAASLLHQNDDELWPKTSRCGCEATTLWRSIRRDSRRFSLNSPWASTSATLAGPVVPFSHSNAQPETRWWLLFNGATMSLFDPAELSIDPRKIRDYLLASDHPRGEAKARFFRSLGFTQERSWELMDELRQMVGAAELIEPVQGPHGMKFVVDGQLRGAWVRTVWIVDPPGAGVRFVTAYPVRRRS